MDNHAKGIVKLSTLTFLSGLCFIVSGLQADAGTSPSTLKILFTHDLHSNFLPQEVVLPDGSRHERGGYARLATAIERERAKDSLGTIVVDAGDFSMGTLFQILFPSEGAELQLMTEMGYDAMTFGNHDFDFRLEGLARSLDSARSIGGGLPAIVASNFNMLSANASRDETEASFHWNDVRRYIVVTRNGLRIGIFGIMGKDASADIQFAPPGLFSDPMETAKQVTKCLRDTEHVDLVVCLSHSGTTANGSNSEDLELAEDVPGINVIVSAHTHRILEQPLHVGNTIIVSAGSNGAYLGELEVKVDGGNVSQQSYRLISIDESVRPDPAINKRITQFQRDVEDDYLSSLGLKFNQVVAQTPFDFESVVYAYAHPGEVGIGNLIADAFRYSVTKAEAGRRRPVDVVIEPLGMIRSSFNEGPITVAEVYRVLSLGLGPDGKPGYPLVTMYVTGKDLIKIFEIEASVSALKDDAHLEFSGAKFAYNLLRLPFNRVMWAEIVDADGSTRPVVSDSLYRVCMNLYTAMMVSNIRQLSYGFASIQGLDSNGVELASSFDGIVDADSTKPGKQEIKEWVALEEYLRSFPKAPNGVPLVPELYHGPVGRIIVESSLNPIDLFRNANGVTFAAIVLVGGIGFVVVKYVVLPVRKRMKKKRPI